MNSDFSIGRVGRWGLLALWALFAAFPVYWMVITAFKNQRDIYQGPFLVPVVDFEPSTLSWERIFGPDRDAVFLGLSNSLILASISAAFAVVLGAFAAYGLARYTYKYGPYRNDDLGFLIVSQRIMPPIVAIIALFAMFRVAGLIDTHLGMIIAYTWFNLPLTVFVLTDFHLVAQAGPTLLKAIEEPPASTVFIVLADEITPDLVTIASRCTIVEFPPVPPEAIAAQLEAEGVPTEVAEVAARAAGGDLDRARLLASDPQVVARRQLWFGAPDRLDGTGHTAMSLADELLATLDEVAEPLQARHADELEELDAAEQTLGERRPGERKRMQERHQREERRVRTDELRAGLAALTDRYREGLAAGGDAAAFTAAAGLVQGVCDALVFNPRERLQVESLLLHLPRPDSR